MLSGIPDSVHRMVVAACMSAKPWIIQSIGLILMRAKVRSFSVRRKKMSVQRGTWADIPYYKKSFLIFALAITLKLTTDVTET